MAMYTVTIRVLGSNGTARTTRMRSPATETEAELYDRAVAKLYPGCHFHGDLPGHSNIGRIASPGRFGGTDLHARVRIDTERC